MKNTINEQHSQHSANHLKLQLKISTKKPTILTNGIVNSKIQNSRRGRQLTDTHAVGPLQICLPAQYHIEYTL